MPGNALIATISLAEWMKVKDAYNEMRIALCAIECGLAGTLHEARDIAAKAVRDTPPTI